MQLNQNKKVRQAISFTENFRENPISFMEKDIKGENNFAILKTTESGKYVRGNMLYYSLNGVEIFTDINNVIFVDIENNTLFVREYEKVLNEINPEDPELKQYIILYTDLGFENGGDEIPLRWEAVQGRTNAYENIKINAPVIDIDKSYVLVETVSFKESLSVRSFVEYLKNADMVEEDGFEIDSFAGSEYM